MFSILYTNQLNKRYSFFLLIFLAISIILLPPFFFCNLVGLIKVKTLFGFSIVIGLYATSTFVNPNLSIDLYVFHKNYLLLIDLTAYIVVVWGELLLLCFVSL